MKIVGKNILPVKGSQDRRSDEEEENGNNVEDATTNTGAVETRQELEQWYLQRQQQQQQQEQLLLLSSDQQQLQTVAPRHDSVHEAAVAVADQPAVVAEVTTAVSSPSYRRRKKPGRPGLTISTLRLLPVSAYDQAYFDESGDPDQSHLFQLDDNLRKVQHLGHQRRLQLAMPELFQVCILLEVYV